MNTFAADRITKVVNDIVNFREDIKRRHESGMSYDSLNPMITYLTAFIGRAILSEPLKQYTVISYEKDRMGFPPGSLINVYIRGLEYFKNGQINEGLDCFSLEMANSLEALLAQGIQFLHGVNVEQDHTKAKEISEQLLERVWDDVLKGKSYLENFTEILHLSRDKLRAHLEGSSDIGLLKATLSPEHTVSQIFADDANAKEATTARLSELRDERLHFLCELKRAESSEPTDDFNFVGWLPSEVSANIYSFLHKSNIPNKITENIEAFKGDVDKPDARMRIR